MATPNFTKYNAQNYYVIAQEGKYIDKNGKECTYLRDSIDYEDLFNDIVYDGEEYGYEAEEGNIRFMNDASIICSRQNKPKSAFKSTKAWFMELQFGSTIVYHSGYYSDGTLDFDINVSTTANVFQLSNYVKMDDFISDILDDLAENVAFYGEEANWNIGTFKLVKKYLKSWIAKEIANEMAFADEFCKKNCEYNLRCIGMFSNGEAIYEMAS